LTSTPDPFLAVELHSEEALANAAAILRRFRLVKAIRFLVGGRFPFKYLLDFLKRPIMRRNLDSLPIWWCPWILDLALMVYVATRGLLVITVDRLQKNIVFRDNDPIFGKFNIEKHLKVLFFEKRHGMKPVLPQCLTT